MGPVELQGVSTYLLTSDLIELPGEAALECAGYWVATGGKNPHPKFSGNYKATLNTPYDVRVSLALLYLGGTDDLGSNEIDFDAETYWDLTAEWSASGNYIFTGGISNLLDTDPQVSFDAGTLPPGNGTTFPAFFDALGRYVFVNLGVSF